MARSTQAESSWAASASARLAEAGYRHGGARADVDEDSWPRLLPGI